MDVSSEEKIVIKAVNKPEKENRDVILTWFCQVFDLGNGQDSTEPVIFKEIVVASFSGKGITSKDLNKKLDIPRSTVIYHLNRFIYTGLVVRKGRRYYLRSEDMASTIEELQADLDREFNRMIQFAEKLDDIFEANSYGRRRQLEGNRGRRVELRERKAARR